MSRNIIIKQSYFTGIQTAINCLNEFFSSGFKTRNFPALDNDVQLDPSIERILSLISNVDPTWLEDENKLREILDEVSDNLQEINPVDGVYATIVDSNNKTLISSIDGYIGFKALQQIADNFQEFTKFINGIYTFEIFTKPSQYADVLNIFTSPLNFEELPELDIEESVFNEEFYVDGLMKNELVELPGDMDVDTEAQRIYNRQDIVDVEVFVDDAVQEAAEVNYFENLKPAHMKHSGNKWAVSKQFKEKVDKLISGLKECNTTDDLKSFFMKPTKDYAEMFGQTIVPYILVKTLTNAKKSSGDFSNDTFKKYTDSYESILKQNAGARRFENYDIFSTFKSDKEGTIKFLEDFLKLNLINDPSVSISNNTLLTIFNIFDSRIYLDIAHNVKGGEMKDENQFVKEIRGRINKNSRTATAYKNDDTEGDNSDNTNDKEPTPEKETSETVSESFMREIRSLGDMSHSDLLYCEHYSDMLEREIDTIGDKIYNAGLSPFLIEEYIGESFNDINSQLGDYVQEANVTKRRGALQSAVNNLMAEMEAIVKLDKSHRWNNNTFVHRYKTTAGMFLSLFPNVTGSTESHTDIKQVYHWTGKAVKGKAGSFTNDQIKVLSRLHDLVGDLWGCVKLFWVNPINWTKHVNLFNNTKDQKRVKDVAQIAGRIFDMKEDLAFLNDDNFVEEAWYDGSPDFIFQEATTKVNNERLNKAVGLLIRDMKKIQELGKNKQWTNNACITLFKSEPIGNLKQAIKYVNHGIGGSCGKYSESEIDVLKDFKEKLDELKKTVNKIIMNPMIGKSIKESADVRKVSSLAGEIVGYESRLEFIKSTESSDTSSSSSSSDDLTTTTQEAFFDRLDLDKFIMEQEDGTLPEYMKQRYKMSDGKDKVTVTPADLPDDVPKNPVPEMTDSIDAKMDAGGDELNDMLGSGFENNPNKKDVEGKIVVNVTNNYNNSFNRDSGNTITNDDHSTGKTITNTDSNNNSSHHNSTDSSKGKNNNIQNKPSGDKKGVNNNNNSSESVDTKDSPTKKDGKQKLSSGKTIQEMFAFLESEEPLSNSIDAGKPPKEDTLTKAMDKDRKSLAKQQKAKKGVQKTVNTGKALLKPITRIKQWLVKVTDSLIKRDEDHVKAELIENPSYRSALYKATRIALAVGLTGFVFTIQPYIAMAMIGVAGLREADKRRLREEARQELEAEIDIIEKKIHDLEYARGDVESNNKQKYEYMRLKRKLEGDLMRITKSHIKHPRDTI